VKHVVSARQRHHFDVRFVNSGVGEIRLDRFCRNSDYAQEPDPRSAGEANEITAWLNGIGIEENI
jgi:hypothetical protein